MRGAYRALAFLWPNKGPPQWVELGPTKRAEKVRGGISGEHAPCDPCCLEVRHRCSGRLGSGRTGLQRDF
eukprot:6057087-Alexandrium_andersonii.AAC.1